MPAGRHLNGEHERGIKLAVPCAVNTGNEAVKIMQLADTDAGTTKVNGIQQSGGIHVASSTATVPHDRRSDAPHTETRSTDATVLTLTSTALDKSTARASPPGLAALYALLQGLQSAELGALPPRTAQLLFELSRHFLPVTDLGNTAQLRNLVLGSGLFLESTPGEEEGDAAFGTRIPPPIDLKALLGQLLALMQPGRQLTVRNGNLQFLSLNPSTAQCLQAYAEEQKHGSRQKTFQSPLLANVETAFLGIVRNQLQSLGQSSEKITRWIMDLMLQHETGPVTLPLTLSYQPQAVPEVWEAEFELELRHCGALHVVLGVKNSTVDVSIAAGRAETLDLLRGGRLTLAQILGRKGLTLGSYVCQRGQDASTG
jgi:hypothetical protein